MFRVSRVRHLVVDDGDSFFRGGRVDLGIVKLSSVESKIKFTEESRKEWYEEFSLGNKKTSSLGLGTIPSSLRKNI